MKTKIKQQTEDISMLIQSINSKFTELKYSFNDNLSNDLKQHQLRNSSQALDLIYRELSNCLFTISRTLDQNIFSLSKD